MDLALVLDLLLVREDVVDEARVVDRRVLQRADGAAAVDLRRDLRAVAHPAQAHGQVGAEGGAPHLQVVDRVGDAVLDLVGQLPHPALGHLVDRRLQTCAAASGVIPAVVRAHRSIEAAFHAVDRDGDLLALDGHAVGEAGRGQARGGEVAAVAEDEGVVVVAVGAPGQPGGAEVEGLGRRVRVEAGRAQREVGGGEPVLVPDALARACPSRCIQAARRGAGAVQVRARARPRTACGSRGAGTGPTFWYGTCV